MDEATAAAAYRDVMLADPPAVTSPLEAAAREFVYGHVWGRAGISRRDRRMVTLVCVAGADAPQPIEDHVYAAIASGDLDVPALQELVLHFAVYCGWPKASHLEGVIRRQAARVQTERGETPTPWPALSNDSLGLNDWDARIERGRQEFADVNLIDAPQGDSAYIHAGILNFVFGHVWQRPGLTRRERRVITVACVGIDDSAIPILTHVGTALRSGDLTKAEMDEIILHFAAYYGFPKAEALQAVADATASSMGS